MENKQEYELVDFKIEDLKGGETLVYEDSEFKFEGFVGNICFLTFEGTIINYTKETFQNKGCFKLQIPKQKLEKIQGFEVREYPEFPLVEVAYEKDFCDAVIRQLAEVQEGYHNFYSKEGKTFMYCRPVPLEKRNFIEIEKD